MLPQVLPMLAVPADDAARATANRRRRLEGRGRAGRATQPRGDLGGTGSQTRVLLEAFEHELIERRGHLHTQPRGRDGRIIGDAVEHRQR